MPIKLYEDYKVINTNVSELLTISPNNSVSSYDFINQIETVRNENNAYVLIERDTFSQPSKLYLLNSDIVNIAIEIIVEKSITLFTLLPVTNLSFIIWICCILNTL